MVVWSPCIPVILHKILMDASTPPYMKSQMHSSVGTPQRCPTPIDQNLQLLYWEEHFQSLLYFGYCPRTVTAYIRSHSKGYIKLYYEYYPNATEWGQSPNFPRLHSLYQKCLHPHLTQDPSRVEGEGSDWAKYPDPLKDSTNGSP